MFESLIEGEDYEMPWEARALWKSSCISDMPDAFLEVLVHDMVAEPSLTAMCVCYEQGSWRKSAFVDHLFEWLPEFALSWSERQTFADATSVDLLRRAAKVVYASDKYERRGEFGELILHAIVRQVFQSEPAISKIFFKDADNDTVKGFDSVHVVNTPDGLELWLGEVKFYKKFSQAVADVVAELQQHLERDYLRSEFLLISNKIDPAWPHADDLKELIHKNKPIDQIFKTVTVPVLLTYDSTVVGGYSEHGDEYEAAITSEVTKHLETFAGKTLPDTVRIRLILLPLEDKKELQKALHEKLKVWQQI